MNEEIEAIGSGIIDVLKDNFFGVLLPMLPKILIVFLVIFCVHFLFQLFRNLIKGN